MLVACTFALSALSAQPASTNPNVQVFEALGKDLTDQLVALKTQNIAAMDAKFPAVKAAQEAAHANLVKPLCAIPEVSKAIGCPAAAATADDYNTIGKKIVSDSATHEALMKSMSTEQLDEHRKRMVQGFESVNEAVETADPKFAERSEAEARSLLEGSGNFTSEMKTALLEIHDKVHKAQLAGSKHALRAAAAASSAATSATKSEVNSLQPQVFTPFDWMYYPMYWTAFPYLYYPFVWNMYAMPNATAVATPPAAGNASEVGFPLVFPPVLYPFPYFYSFSLYWPFFP